MVDTFDKQIADQSGYLNVIAIQFCKNSFDREDLVGDTICNALQKKRQYKEDTNIKAWLYTMMRNIFINKYRRAQKNPISYIFDNDDTHEDTFAGIAEEYTHIDKFEWSEMLKVFDLMPQPHGDILLAHTKGFKYREIAKLFDVPEGTVKSRIHQCRLIFMNLLLESKSCEITDLPRRAVKMLKRSNKDSFTNIAKSINGQPVNKLKSVVVPVKMQKPKEVELIIEPITTLKTVTTMNESSKIKPNLELSWDKAKRLQGFFIMEREQTKTDLKALREQITKLEQDEREYDDIIKRLGTPDKDFAIITATQKQTPIEEMTLNLGESSRILDGLNPPVISQSNGDAHVQFGGFPRKSPMAGILEQPKEEKKTIKEQKLTQIPYKAKESRNRYVQSKKSIENSAMGKIVFPYLKESAIPVTADQIVETLISANYDNNTSPDTLRNRFSVWFSAAKKQNLLVGMQPLTGNKQHRVYHTTRWATPENLMKESLRIIK